MNDDNIPHAQHQVTVRMPQMPGMTAGEQGVAGMGAPGPNVRVVTIPRWRFVLEHVIGYSYLKGLAAVMALEAGGQLESHGDSVFGNVWFLMSRAVLPALGFIVAEGLKYEVKRRQALGLGE